MAHQIHGQATSGEKLSGVNLGHSRVKISFLTFFNDTMLFAKASNQSCSIIKSVMDKYYVVSGQLVNFHTSYFQCTKNVSPEEISSFQSILQMNSSFSLGSYLGCPIIDSRVTKNTFQKVTQSSQSQLSKWKANSLSRAGRVVFVQANLTIKANFHMQSFLLLASLQ